MNATDISRTQPHCILAVDDDPKILHLTEMILTKEAYSVALAGSVEEARKILQERKVDLVLLDVMLSDGDGFSLCKSIKENAETRDIPVILLTALDTIDSKVRGLDVGASDYLVKPFLKKELLARIRSHLREREFAQEMKTLYAYEKQRAHQVAILNKLTTEFNQSLDQMELLQHAAQVISTELNFQGCLIATWDDRASRLSVAAAYRPGHDLRFDGNSFQTEQGIMGWVASHREPRIVPDVQMEPQYLRFFRDTRSEMAVPLVHQKKILGVLNVESHLPHAYNSDHLNLLTMVAGNLALALKNAELYSTAKVHSQNLKSMVELRTRELESQKRFMECIVDSLPIGLYVVDKDYSVTTWNRKRETGILGISREQVIGQNVLSVFSNMSSDRLKTEIDHVFSTGQPFETQTASWSSGEKRYYHLRKIPMSIDGSAVSHVITLGEDITERRRMEESLATNEKLASIGKLAAGIAHEINNPLAAIAGCVEGLISRAQDEALARVAAFEDFPEYLKIIDGEIFRCKGIINNLLDFSRNKEILKQEIRVNETLEQTLQLLSHHKSFKQIQVVKELDSECPPVVGNSGELRQVFLAMCINAMDAMNESGMLTIRTTTEMHNNQSFVRVQFQDTGIGIPPGNLNKIFDPFFTTKPVGKGTGLGLSICYGIVRSHEGSIKVESEIGKGSTFQILVPAKAINQISGS
ncbi:MAG: response regulator [Acidobacteria bacterium]|nr:response regulator [Acidobacteriota bacterium]MCI0626339.1 response regulator [Acidobacteriota bacterium]MCI0718524.1 response regulator [Acidobacteriota bacterium]